MNLQKELLKARDPLRPFGRDLDVLPYYAFVSLHLQKFVDDRELATKVFLENGEFFVKRGSIEPDLHAKDLVEEFSKEFFEIRKNSHSLDDARNKLNEKQINIWHYFPPRKLIELHYAVNYEKPGSSKTRMGAFEHAQIANHEKMNRLYLDFDRSKDIPLEHAAKDVASIAQTIEEDKKFESEFGEFSLLPVFTGFSFHLYIFLEKSFSHRQYEEFLSLQNKANFVSLWVEQLRNSGHREIFAEHERKEGKMVVDISQSPSGKLARCPFSLHLHEGKVSGLSVPMNFRNLDDKKFLKELENLTPKIVVEKIEDFAKNFPKL